MKNYLFLLVIAIFISASAEGQTIGWLDKYMDVTVGYAPNTDIKAVKFNVAANNLVITRFGVYTSFEIGTDSDYFSNIMGITGSITDYLYLFAGVDLYTKVGLVYNNKFVRKELGLGVTPFKWVSVRLGYSTGVGPTISAGVKIPFN